MPNKQFTTGRPIKWSLIVIVVCLLGATSSGIVQPTPANRSRENRVVTVVAVLGVLGAAVYSKHLRFYVRTCWR